MLESRPIFSLIIPTINEEGILADSLSAINNNDPEVEIIVADGGSDDRTVAIALEHKVKVCRSERGRGTQCNTGADLASGDILIFLHADTHLPTGAITKLEEIFRDDRVQIGTFRISFDVPHWLLQLFCFLSRFDMGWFRFGDQCIVVRKSFFTRIGGFPRWHLFEDLELMRKARKHTKIYRFPMTVVTSARRFIENGVIRQQFRNSYYTALYLFGVSPDKIVTRYEYKREACTDTSLIIFVRFPHPGKVKTRLAQSIGDTEASRFYRLCAEYTFNEMKKLSKNIRSYVFYADINDKDNVRKWAGPAFQFMPQVEGDLGTRMESAFNHVFIEGALKAIIIGSDVPDLSTEDVKSAIGALDSYDLVIGPTNDGGYYLLGMKRLYGELFHGITWSTSEVYKETLKVAEYLDLQVYCLRMLDDIDTGDDLKRWIESTSRAHNMVRLAINSTSVNTT